MASRTKIANEAWEALFRAQATIARELAAGDVWGKLSPREYGVLYALSDAPDGLRITELGNDVRHGLHVAETMTRTLSREQLLQLRDLCRALTATTVETSRA
jgi:hypothetical protein